MSTKGKKKGRTGGRKGEVASSSSVAPAQPDDQPQLTFEDAIDQIEQMIEQSDLIAAEEALRSQFMLGSLRPSDINQHHSGLVPAMELLGQVLIGQNRSKEAFEWLRACCALQPDGGAEKWMYYGQLIGGSDAIDAFKRGITCMFKTQQTILANQQAEAQRQQTNAFTMGEFESPQTLQQQLLAINKQISSGYACMAELYVTDLCDEPNAESECEKLLDLAIRSFPENPDALYALANLRTIQQRIPEACEVMTKLFSVLAAHRAASIENMPIVAMAENQDNDALPAQINLADVSYELRVAAAKLALELQAFQPALELLEQLFEEDDHILEVPHLAAVCAFNLGQFNAALDFIEHAEGLLSMEQDDGMRDAEGEEGEKQQVDQAEIDATKRALAQLKAEVKEQKKHAPPEMEQPDGEEEEDGEDDGQDEGEQKDADGDATMQD